jgi:sulfate adenylyltransferase subunit 1 (EFTu-like GTPase family)
MGRNGNGNGNDSHYAAVNRSDVPQGRKGKHRKAVGDILADLSKLSAQQAVKIPLSSLNGEKMQNLRSALNRVTREKNLSVLTSSDDKYLYVWRADPPKNSRATE